MANGDLNTPVVIQANRIDSTLLPAAFSQPYRLYVIQQGADFGAVAGKANEAGQGAYDAQVKNEEQDVILSNHESRIEDAEAAIINHESRITAAEATLVNHEARITANEVELADHEIRITQNTNAISALTVRMVSAENAITNIQTNVGSLTTRVTTAEGNITTLQTNVSALQSSVTAIQADYISKSSPTNQSVQSSGGSLLIGSVPSPTTDKLQVTGSGNVSISYKVAGVQVLGARQTGWTASTGTAYKGAFNADQTYGIGSLFNPTELQAIAAGLKEARQRIKALEDADRAHGQIN